MPTKKKTPSKKAVKAVETVPDAMGDDLRRDFFSEMCRIERWSFCAMRDRISGMMDARPTIATTSPCDVPVPILLNRHKHLAGFLRERVQHAIAAGAAGLQSLADELVVVGAHLMDLYHGPFAPVEISDKVLTILRTNDCGTQAAFAAWVEAGGGYRMILFSEDTAQWVLRVGDAEGRFVHVHPARNSPFTIRVRANMLTTAVLALAYTGVHGGDPLARRIVNCVRREYLGLAPIGRDLSTAEGIGAVIELLR